jgi:hypothetical protein
MAQLLSTERTGDMRSAIRVLMMLITLFAAAAAQARGGQSADDCPPGTTDPDCKGR